MTFELATPDTIEEAIELSCDGSRWFAGGTDLVPEYKLGLANPTRLINLKRIAGMRGITSTEEALRIGALTTLAEIASDTTTRREYSALARACELSASPQVRNVATLAGNLCQDSRCPYYRGAFQCYLKGGSTCFMRDGENTTGAVIGFRDCVHAHPSDPAIALVALDAQIDVQGHYSQRIVPAGDLLRAPDENDRRMNTLVAGEVIREIRIPRLRNGSMSIFLKAMDRASWAFVLTSVAIRLDFDNDMISDARVILGGVAPVPWRESSVEQHLRGQALNQELALKAGQVTLLGATPLTHNRYKVRLGRALVKRALVDLASSFKGGS